MNNALCVFVRDSGRACAGNADGHRTVRPAAARAQTPTVSPHAHPVVCFVRTGPSESLVHFLLGWKCPNRRDAFCQKPASFAKLPHWGLGGWKDGSNLPLRRPRGCGSWAQVTPQRGRQLARPPAQWSTCCLQMPRPAWPQPPGWQHSKLLILKSRPPFAVEHERSHWQRKGQLRGATEGGAGPAPQPHLCLLTPDSSALPHQRHGLPKTVNVPSVCSVPVLYTPCSV